MLVMALHAALVCGCAAPPYQPVSTDQTARIRFVNVDKPDICVSGHRFTLALDGNGHVSVPAGRPVHLIGAYSRNAGLCFPAVKFVPQAGQAYDLVNDVRAERCIFSVMRHDASAQYGLRVEPSVNASHVCPR
jgi:urease alpha subunit